jgi:ATP-binding protein involved in chromosome partitioning
MSENTEEKKSKRAHRQLQDMVIHRVLDRIKYKLFVMSGKGGVGKSTVAVNLALALTRTTTGTVGLLDVDLHGPSVPRMLGLSVNAQVDESRNISPVSYNPKLEVLSIESIVRDKDTAIVWRGPLKLNMIRQFISDVEWGDLDYLVIDSPPGTGDEPLTVAQTIGGAQAVVVTTPQEIALADVRKSINFCKQVNLKVLGVVENMSGFVCPKCGERIDMFSSGGGEKLAKDAGIPFLGRIPLDPEVVKSGDQGRPYLAAARDTETGRAYREVVDRVLEELAKTPLDPGPVEPHAH